MNRELQNPEYRQTVSWETYLSKYVMFRATSSNNTYNYEETTDINDGSNIHSFSEKYNFVVTSSQQEDETYFEYPSSD
jgi:hypothetical protein